MPSKFTWFALGAAAGAAAALLYAPRPGVETRALVGEKANAVCGEARDWGAATSINASDAYRKAQDRGSVAYQNAQVKGREFAKNAQEKTSDLYNTAAARVQEKIHGVSPAFSGSNDDLREKIEAARQRIAAQVAANAEESQVQAADDVVETSAAEAPAAEAPAPEPAGAHAAAPAADSSEEGKAE